jgi:hypothetical protein
MKSNNFFQIIFLIIIYNSLFSCDSKISSKMPKDFDIDFIYGHAEQYEFNSFIGTFKKSLTWGKDTTIKFKLCSKEKEKIYRQYLRLKIYNFPESFEPKSNIDKTGLPSYFIKIRSDGQTKKIIWQNNTNSNDRRAKQLRNWFNSIIELLENDPAIKKLPEDDRPFL